MRAWSRFGAVSVAVSLAGCVTTGESEVDAEIARRQGETGVAVVEAAPERAVFIAKGAEVVIEPPAGYCLDADSISVNGSAGFTMIADCLTKQVPAAADGGDAQEAAEITLPRSFPGILTMSISAQPAVDTSPQALDEFEALLSSPEGLQLVGRGIARSPGNVVATRRVGGAFYVLVEGPDGPGRILSRRFWRAFAGINDRLVLTTVSGFRDSEVSDEAMLGFLMRQIRRLRRANGMPAIAEETEIIEAVTAGRPSPGAAEVVLAGTGDEADVDGIAPAAAPEAPEKPERDG